MGDGREADDSNEQKSTSGEATNAQEEKGDK